MKLQSLMTLFTLSVAHMGLYAQSHLDVQVQQTPVNNEVYYYNDQGQPNQITIHRQEYIQTLPPGERVNLPSNTNQGRPVENRQINNNQMNQRPVGQIQRTLSIIKPDAVESNHIGDIISRFEKSGLRIVGIKILNLSKDQASKFYQVHRDRPFYPQLVDFMSSGPVVIMVLEGDNAIAKNRELMGATDPKKAASGTIRADYAQSVSRNAVHGSDSPETAKEEILFFFQPNELVQRK